jgi:asparagine synthase (glutamine-hydrolysing)
VEAARWRFREVDPTADIRLLEGCARQPAWVRRHDGWDRAVCRTAMADRLPDSIRLKRTRGAQLPDWLDRVTDARAELVEELDLTRDHPSSRSLLDIARLEGATRDWPQPDEAGDRERIISHRLVLPRSLAVSRYVRWFEEWARARPPVRA